MNFALILFVLTVLTGAMVLDHLGVGQGAGQEQIVGGPLVDSDAHTGAVHVRAAHVALLGAESLQGIEPMLVVTVTDVRLTSLLSCFDLSTQDHSPFGPGEPAGLRQAHRQGEGMGLPRIAKDRALGVAGKRRQIMDAWAKFVNALSVTGGQVVSIRAGRND